MKKNLAWVISAIAFFATVQHAQAGSVSLADWCVNLNGDTNTACNGGGSGGTSPSGGSISLSNFSTVLEPGSNNLGTITISLSAGNNQYVAFYADYDVDFATQGSFTDTAAKHGSLPAGSSYEIADPNSGALFNDFSSVSSSNGLSDQNNLGSPSGPPNECCDAAFALAFGSINVATTGTVTFAITTTAPTSGFYIEQTNNITGDSIFVQETVSLGPQTGSPEPPTFVLGFGLIGLALAWKRQRSA